MRSVLVCGIIVVALAAACCALGQITDPSATSTPTPTTTAAAATTTSTAAPAPPADQPDSDAKKFGISTATFFSAMTLWFIICFALSKWEDSRSGANNQAGAVAVASSDPGTAYAAPPKASSGTTDNYAGGADAGYMPVSIPGAGSTAAVPQGRI